MKIRYHEKELEVEKGKTIYEILKDEIENSKYTVVGAIYNNEYTILGRKITEDGEIELDLKPIEISFTKMEEKN